MRETDIPRVAPAHRGHEVPHGTVSRYNNKQCRCAPCRLAHNTYRRTNVSTRRAMGLCLRCDTRTRGVHCEVHRLAFNAAQVRRTKRKREDARGAARPGSKGAV